MDSSVVAGVEEALAAAGLVVLRFNFRGVGRSQGAFDDGLGEADDAVAALAFLAEQVGVAGGRMGLAGYSFSAGVAAVAAGREEQVRALALVSCPRRALEAPALQGLAKPKLLIGGDRDHIVDGTAFESITRGLRDPKEAHLVEGADRFWQGRERTVGGMVADFFVRRLASSS
jgi:alpha/beta superfamily hydrolase